jgi:hypothetical protein
MIRRAARIVSLLGEAQGAARPGFLSLTSTRGRYIAPGRWQPEELRMQGQGLNAPMTDLIDNALESYRGRDLVAAAEVTDLLLDLRVMLLAADEAPATPAR